MRHHRWPAICDEGRTGSRQLEQNPTLGRVGQHGAVKTLGVPARARMISLGNSRAEDVDVNMAWGGAEMRLLLGSKHRRGA
jgi:hypothetical protein